MDEYGSHPLILLLLTDTIKTRTGMDHMETQKAKTNLLLVFKNLPRMMSSSNTRIVEIISQEINNNQYLIVKIGAITNSSH